MNTWEAPQAQGMYDPRHEHEACGLGFVAQMSGRKTHEVIQQALAMLGRLEHRGTVGAEADTGDGAGLLLQIPHDFLAQVLDKLLPVPESYAVGMVFLPAQIADREACERIFERIVREEGQDVVGWRDVPTVPALLGPTAQAACPAVRQAIVTKSSDIKDLAEFERELYVIRRRVEKAVKRSHLAQRSMFYVCSLSARTLVYKGMLTTHQLPLFYPDLQDARVVSALAVVHSRFSTNTFPSWGRAHPYRFIAHNGEINTLRGNANWMHARESRCASDLFGADLAKVWPAIESEGSDSAQFDNVLELLTLAGRTLPHSLLMMMPEPWGGDPTMDAAKRAFYEYHSYLMEPWDGPAAVIFTDGVQVGGVLDRNGLRPARYYVTRDGLVILSSEVGVVDVPPAEVVAKGRLEPGHMFLVDTAAGRIVSDEEIKSELAAAQPYQAWIDANSLRLQELQKAAAPFTPPRTPLLARQKMFGYTREEITMLLTPMARDGAEAIGSMGTDTPLAVLSQRPQLLYHYFKQLFAQVTNPPIDALREAIVVATETTIGPEANLLQPTPAAARQINLPCPLLTNEELAKLRYLDALREDAAPQGFRVVTLPMLYEVGEGGRALERAVEDLCGQAAAAVEMGYEIIILSDRWADERLAPVPALLAVSAVHHHLIRAGTRTQVGLIVESGEPREVHHFAMLLAYGAAAVNPYLAFETLGAMVAENAWPSLDYRTAVKNYLKAVTKGIVKVISKMGLATIQSYCGAQLAEAIGLRQDVVDKYFTWTPTRIGGVGLDVIAEETALRHADAFAPVQTALAAGGEYKWGNDGPTHQYNPKTIHKMQWACRTGDFAAFQEYSREVNETERNFNTLRSLMALKPAGAPVPLAEVESVESIVRRFKTGAMSYGSIGQEAHEALAVAMNRLGGKSNSGEGGEDAARYTPDADGDSRSSAIKQIASGRFGVTSHYLVNAQELQIKVAQGAKPGEGGQLPGDKVYPWVARVRHATPGVGLISPPPHHDIYSIEDLAELIFDLKNANDRARISVKLVSEVGVGTIAAGVAKAHADVILISGYDGGTGASPLTSIKHAGAPWEMGLAETHQTLLLNGLRQRVRLETDGQLKTGRDVVVAALLGADEFGFATAPLIALGCLVMRACHLNTCPVGIATQDPRLREKFAGRPEYVINFMRFVAQETRELMAQLGFRTLDEMTGRTDCLEMRVGIEHWKAHGLDLAQMLYRPSVAQSPRAPRLSSAVLTENVLDKNALLEICGPALTTGVKIVAELPICNTDRATGTLLGNEITRRWGAAGLPADTVRLTFTGSAGQSFGAFVPHGVTLTLRGDANDYVGKGLSGGKLIVVPPAETTFAAASNVIIGNVALYGATSGTAYIYGMAGERFAVRNSGAQAVVEAVGAHGCEYMTGGRVVVLGPTGRNFAAGMSGGVAYIYDLQGVFAVRCNQEMVDLSALSDTDEDEREAVRDLIFGYALATGSSRANEILVDWDTATANFVRVMPREYALALQKAKQVSVAESDEQYSVGLRR